MKYLSLKLGILVVLLFSVVIVVCLQWTPAKLRYYINRFRKSDLEQKAKCIDALILLGDKGHWGINKAIGNTKKSELIIKYWNNSNNFINRSDTPLTLAVRNNWKDVTGLFLEKGADPNQCNVFFDPNGGIDPPLYVAVKSTNIEIADLLIERGADVNGGGWFLENPICLAIQDSNLVMFKYLLDKGANLNLEYNTLLEYAAKKGKLEMVQVLLSRGIRNGLPLHNVFRASGSKVVEYLLNNGFDINEMDSKGRTPLQRACSYNRGVDKEIPLLLIQKGANVNLAQTGQDTPLHLAAYKGDVEVVKMLIAHGAKINAQNKYGHTPLYSATDSGKQKIVKLLRAHGAKTKEELKKEQEKK